MIYVIYHSQQYGNTAKMAQAVAEGIRRAGASCELVNTYEKAPNIDLVRQADALAIGSPDYFGYVAGTLKVFMDEWYFAKRNNPEGLSGKAYGLFYSHGGGGRVRTAMESLFAALRGEKIGDTVESRGTPDASVLDACRDLGRQLATTQSQTA